MTKPSVLLIAGHRSINDHGNPDETELTDDMAHAYEVELKGWGYPVVSIPDNELGPELPGGLDNFGRLMAAWAAKTPGPKVLLDLHFGGEPVGGCFAIVPDVTGLSSAAPGWYNPADTWEHNTLDRELAAEIVNRMSAVTKMPQRTVGVREVGLMDESQTGVGINGWRLATFAYTAPYQANTVRLVIEHGNLNRNAPNERAQIFSPGFPHKCAVAAVDAIAAVYDIAAEPEPVPEPPFLLDPKLIWPKQTRGLVGKLWAKESARRRSWGVPNPEVWNKADGMGGRLYLFTDGLLIRRDDETGDVTRV